MKNPFVFGEVVKGEYFTDREEEVKELTLDLSSGQNILLFSPRRYGKTSLILRVLDHLKKEGMIPVYLDLFRMTSVHSFIKLYTAAVTRSAATKLEEAVAFAKKHLTSLIPKVVIKTGEEAEFEIDLGYAPRDEEKLLDDLYDLPQKLAVQRRRQLVVVFDEFQEITNLPIPLDRSLRAKIQHHDKVAYCFMGSKRHLLDGLFLDKNKPLYRVAKPVPLGKITPERLKHFIHARFQSVGMLIENAIMDEILKITACHPYYTQQLCHEIFNHGYSRQGSGAITLKDIEVAQDKCLAAQSYAYATIWDGLVGKQRDVVLALALDPPENLYAQEYLARHNLGSPATVQTSIRALEKKGLVERVNGGYELADMFFTGWLEKKIS